MHKHATVSAWQRAEDGSYRAEINGWQLEVRWRPEPSHGAPASGPPGHRRGFYWKATSPLGEKHVAREVEEEIELAMAAAEQVAHAAAASVPGGDAAA